MVKEEKNKLLIVEDDKGLQKQLKWCFEDYELSFAEDRESAIAQLRRNEPAVVLQDLGLPPDAEGVSEGIATLEEILKLSPETKVIVVTGNDDTENAVRSVGLGAYDFYRKPVDTDVLKLLVERAFSMWVLEEQNRRLMSAGGNMPIDGVIAVSKEMQQVCRMIEKVAPSDVSVLILGASGTGKELLARAVHDLSERKARPFVAINCASIPENLLESELFGHEKGAFTGAYKQTIGKVEGASGGTLFLDEIGDMPPPLQAKMLRFLQERVIERVGGRKEIPVDVRVVCATNQDLHDLIGKGEFREDLYYRIAEVSIDLPLLKDRTGDISALAYLTLEQLGVQQGKPPRRFSEDAVQAMEAYAWPGNVRELQNKIKAASVMAEGKLVTAEDLALVTPDGASDGLMLNLKAVRGQAEKDAVQKALAMARDNVAKAAALLGVTRPTLYDLMNRHEIGNGKSDGKEG
ncbi:MAG: PEP-CTERM-box response regulator transcription factor [Gammaproteobacteria bacterium]|nr:PEP-CTERM-box response regulator transcription factor [Gammaproteobacteria bacterium]